MVPSGCIDLFRAHFDADSLRGPIQSEAAALLEDIGFDPCGSGFLKFTLAQYDAEPTVVLVSIKLYLSVHLALYEYFLKNLNTDALSVKDRRMAFQT